MKSKPKVSKSVGTRSTHLGKTEKPGGEKPPSAKRLRSSIKVDIKVDDCMNLHDNKLGTNFTFLAVLCKYLVTDAYYVVARVLTTGYAKGQLIVISGDLSISVDNRRTAGRT